MHVRSLFSEKVIDVFKANTVDLGPLSFDSFRKNNLSASWKFSVQEDLIPHEFLDQIVETDKKRTPRGQEDKTFDVVSLKPLIRLQNWREGLRFEKLEQIGDGEWLSTW